MDNTAQLQTNTLLTPQDVDGFFKDLGMENLPQDRKDSMVQVMMETVLDRVFLRIEPSLTDQDRITLETLSTQPDGQNLSLGYIMTKVPNLDQIATEEIANYRQEMKAQVDAVVSTLNSEDSGDQNQS
jgi:hypothetical protein